MHLNAHKLKAVAMPDQTSGSRCIRGEAVTTLVTVMPQTIPMEAAKKQGNAVSNSVTRLKLSKQITLLGGLSCIVGRSFVRFKSWAEPFSFFRAPLRSDGHTQALTPDSVLQQNWRGFISGPFASPISEGGVTYSGIHHSRLIEE